MDLAETVMVAAETVMVLETPSSIIRIGVFRSLGIVKLVNLTNIPLLRNPKRFSKTVFETSSKTLEKRFPEI